MRLAYCIVFKEGLEERGPSCQLIAVIDDATSRFYARFTEHDTTEENLRTFGEWLRRYGRPLAHYTDKNSIFRTSTGAPGYSFAIASCHRHLPCSNAQFPRHYAPLSPTIQSP
jgi:hypothetical protein